MRYPFEEKYHYLVVGAGIIGLTVARALKRRYPERSVCVIEKESRVAMHASGRNSGVLHAGFYYAADSLKAKFARDGNRAMTRYCEENGIEINKCGKIIVAANERELEGPEELRRRGDRNGVELRWLDEEEAKHIDPNVRTCGKALFSPSTSTVDPLQVCSRLQSENERNGVVFRFDTGFVGRNGSRVETTRGFVECEFLVNAAGLYADRIARDYGFGLSYTILPFKGIYLKYAKNKTDVSTNIYPVPNLKNPFLGVHFTKTVDGTIKIGPTAIPAFWRENYGGLHRFKWREFAEILYYQAKALLKNSFNFRSLAIEEMKKYRKSNFIRQSLRLIGRLDEKGFGEYLRPGIRAQLLNKETLELVQDFVLEGDGRSMHVLNAVSPAFTCSLPFAEHVVDEIVRRQETRWHVANDEVQEPRANRRRVD